MSPSVISLDAGNTLFTERLSRDEMYAIALADCGMPAPDVARIAAERERVHDAMPEVWDGHPRYSDGWFVGYMERLLAALDSGADPEQVRALLAERFSRPESFVLYGDTLPALEDLLERGLRLAVVSNWSTRLRGLLDGLALTRYFETIVISEEVGHTKPAAGIFEHALGQLSAPASAVVHVGDHPERDVAGARRAGLGALLIDRPGRRPRGPGVIRSLEEIGLRLDGPGEA